MEKKKQLILLVLKLLENESDQEHLLTQTAITKAISAVYPCDRKTVGRNMKTLKEIGYPIVKTAKGFYLDNKAFTVDEIEFIRSAILALDAEKKELANRVGDALSRQYAGK